MILDLFTLHRVADAAEHSAANLIKTAGATEGVDIATQSAIAGAFVGFAVVLRAMETGPVELSKVPTHIMERVSVILQEQQDNSNNVG